jgi:hypothetical protein
MAPGRVLLMGKKILGFFGLSFIIDWKLNLEAESIT